MSATRPGQLLRRLAPPDPDDGPLLARFAADRDPAAFAALVRRHGPLVLAVCRRVTGHPQDAEDAFQAVFLVLAKKAGALRDPGRLGNWLYGVAAKVASRARRAAARRRVREVQTVDPPDPAAPDLAPPADIGPALHEELAALPAHYREPIVLCDLQGATRAEAAKALGVPEGTLSSRLANGRKKLADRLTRRGVVLSALGVPAAVAEGRAAVPESLVHNTCGVVAAWAAGAAVPAVVVRLAAGGFPVKSVLLGGILALSLAAGVVIAGAGADPVPRQNPPSPSPPPAVAVAADAPQDAEEQPPKGNDAAAKDATFTTSPKLRDAIDLPVRNGRRLAWSPAGDRLVVVAPPEGAAGVPGGEGGLTSEVLHVVRTTNPSAPQPVGFVNIAAPQRFIGFTPDGHVVTAQREQKLVSGRHRAAVWLLATEPAGPGGGLAGAGGPPPMGGGPGGVTLSLTLRKSFDIDPEQTNDFAFAADGKSYRTLALTRDDSAIRKVTVRRVSAETGKTIQEPGAVVEGNFAAAQLTADGKQVATFGVANRAVSMSPAGGGDGAAWTTTPDLNLTETGERIYPMPLGLSRDGRRVLVSHAFCRPALLDGTTGKALPILEGTELVHAPAVGAAFTADGRLVALPYQRVEIKEWPGKAGGLGPKQTSLSAGEARLGVWDVTTGKLLRSWPGQVTAVAFHPTRPVLAVLEPNGAQTRLGLWDFSAE